MNTFKKSTVFKNVVKEIDYLASAIAERGYDDHYQEWDDYAILIQSYEFRKLVTFELYDSYFPPKRHEFELHLLTQLVDAVVVSKSAEFLAGAAVAGVIGNAVYDMLKAALTHIIKQFKKVRRTHDAMREIAENVEKIYMYMDRHDDVDTSQISSDLDIEACKIEPILKLLGCRSRHTKKRRFWKKPEIW